MSLRSTAHSRLQTEQRPSYQRDGRRVWAFVAIAIAVVGLAGALGSLREPQYWDAAGFYVPLAHEIYHDPTDLVLDSSPVIPNTPGQGVVIAVGWVLTGENVWMPHLVSLAAAALVLWAVYRFVRRYDDDGFTAAAAVAVLAAVPVFQSQARLSHPETLAAACLMLAVLSLAQRRTLAGGLWLAAATMAKNTSLATVPLLAIWTGWWTTRRSESKTDIGRVLTVALRVAAPAAAMAVGWFVYDNIVTHGVTFSSGLTFSADPGGKLSAGFVVSRVWNRLRQLTVPAALGPLAFVAFGVAVARWRRLSVETCGIVVLGALPALSLIAALGVVGVPLPRYVVPILAPLVCSLVLLAAQRGRTCLAIGAGLSVLLGVALMWRTLPWLAPIKVARARVVIPTAAIVLAVSGILALKRRATMATAAGVVAGSLLLFYVWGTTRHPDPEGNLSYRYLLARDQKVLDVVQQEWRRDPTLVVTTDLRDSFFAYTSYLRYPYLRWVDQAIPFAYPAQVPCRYVMISTPDVVSTYPVERLVAVIKPDAAGPRWRSSETRQVSIVNCALKQT